MSAWFFDATTCCLANSAVMGDQCRNRSRYRAVRAGRFRPAGARRRTHDDGSRDSRDQRSSIPLRGSPGFSLVSSARRGTSHDASSSRALCAGGWRKKNDQSLAERFAVIGFARRELSHEAFRAEMRAAVDQYSRLRPRQIGGLGSGWQEASTTCRAPSRTAPDTRPSVRQLAEVEARYGTCGNRMYYLATPPVSYPDRRRPTRGGQLVSEPWPELSSPDWPCWSRVIVEKPFGETWRGNQAERRDP